MKLLLINQGHSDNIGDIAIQYTINKYAEKLFTTELAPFDFPIFQNGTIVGEVLEKVCRHLPIVHDALTMMRISKTLDKVKCDAAIIGGGELIGGTFGQFASDFYAWTKVLSQRDIPIHVIGISGSKPRYHWIKRRYKHALSLCETVGARDHHSQALIRSIYRRADCYWAPDVVFALKRVGGFENKNPASHQVKRTSIICAPCRIDHEPNSLSHLGITDMKEYYEYVCRLLDRVTKSTSADAIFFTSTAIEDSEVTRDVYEHYLSRKEQSKVSAVLIPYQDLSGYIELAEKSAAVVSGRMHACIIGLLYGCQFHVIPFKTKLKVFENEYSCNTNLSDIESKSMQAIYNLLNVIKL